MAKIPTIGELRNRIEFQTVTKIENPQFRKVSVWETQFTVWGKISTSPGLRFNRGDNLEPTVSHIITVRHRNDIVRGMRMRSNGLEFKITKLIQVEEGKNRFIVIHSEEIDNVT